MVSPSDGDGMPKAGDEIAGKYRVERVLGSGGMGAVLAVRHLQLDELVALKVLLPSLMQYPDVVARFLQEGRAATKIRGEHVARVIDVGTLASGVPFLVMEYLDGTDLDRLVARSGPVPVAQAVEYVLQACEALAEAHGRHLVHRDLKPANLFLIKKPDGRPCIKVLDFGISKFVGQATSPGLTDPRAVLGSPRYMAPEQMRSSRDVDARADIWALGAILHELISGKPPFDAVSLQELTAQILTDDPRPLRSLRPDVSVDLSEAVQRCLSKDPAERFEDVAELAQAIAPAGNASASEGAMAVARILAGARASDGRASAAELGVAETLPGGAGFATGRGVTGPRRTTARRTWGPTAAAARRRQVRQRTLAAAFLAVAVVGVGAFVFQRLAPSPVLPPASAQGQPAQPSTVTPAVAPVTVAQGGTVEPTSSAEVIPPPTASAAPSSAVLPAPLRERPLVREPRGSSGGATTPHVAPPVAPSPVVAPAEGPRPAASAAGPAHSNEMFDERK